MGSIVDDFRLPPDPKIGGSRAAHMPELTVNELRQLRTMLLGFRAFYDNSVTYGRILVHESYPPHARGPGNSIIQDAYLRFEPVLKKVLGE